jgi:hypothetical protein
LTTPHRSGLARIKVEFEFEFEFEKSIKKPTGCDAGGSVSKGDALHVLNRAY